MLFFSLSNLFTFNFHLLTSSNFGLFQYNIHCEWGIKGIELYAPLSDVIIIVDVLSFSTAVDIACNNGAQVYPFQWKDERLLHYSESKNAIPANPIRNYKEFSLSPYSLEEIPSLTKLVLPSPNGSTLSLVADGVPTICGCLRNFRSVAEYAMKIGKRITVIPAGEKWDDGSIRFALEDLFGAGAILSCLSGSLSPESKMAVNVYDSLHNLETETLLNCVSGIELVSKGFEIDVYLAADMNVSTCIPVLKDGAYINMNSLKK